MPIHSWLDRPHLHVVHADGVLEVGVGRQPGYHGGGGGDGGRLDAGGSQGRVLPDHHGAGGVSGGAAVGGHRAHADPVELWRREADFSFLFLFCFLFFILILILFLRGKVWGYEWYGGSGGADGLVWVGMV